MPTKEFEISYYEISLLGQMLYPYDDKQITVNAIIRCKGKNNETFDILVTDEWKILPPYSKITNNSVQGKIFIQPERYTWFVDLIRNEGPIHVIIDDTDPSNNRLDVYGM